MMGATNRYYSWKKAIRKSRIDRQVHWYGRGLDSSWYNNLHE